MSDAMRSIIRDFLDWQRVACGGNGDNYLNGEVDRAGNRRVGDVCRDGWDDLDDICKRARKALRK